jgi:type IV secretion system protein VirB9
MKTLSIGLGLWLLFASLALAQEETCPGGTREVQSALSISRARTPLETLAAANASARQGPDPASFAQARQIYTFAPGAIYELYTNPNYISAILLEPGESLSDVAAGDTSRWMVSETHAEAQIEGRIVVLVKPQASNLRTNIVLVTDRRTYTIEAIAQSGQAYSAQVAWCYPRAVETSAEIGDLNFAYRIRIVRGSRPAWAPTHAFDDGRRTWIEMPEATAATDLPPLFIITGEGAELVNYRFVEGRYLVDRTFDVAELRLGTRAPTIVRIEREGLPSRRPRRSGARS